MKWQEKENVGGKLMDSVMGANTFRVLIVVLHGLVSRSLDAQIAVRGILDIGRLNILKGV